MTVSTAYVPLTYNGNSSTTAFSVTWPFFDSTLVVTAIASTGVETVQTLTTHYTVTGGTDDDGLPATGTVTMVTAPATGSQLRITRSTTKTQGSTWAENDPFPQATIEAALDKLTLLAQEAGAGGSLLDGISGDVMTLDSSGATDFWDAEDQIIRNVATPTADDDAVTKAYADAVIVTAAASATAAAASASTASSAATSATASASSAATNATNTLSYYNLTVANYVQPSSTVAYTYLILDDIESGFNGATTTFALALAAAAFTPDSAAGLLVHINGVYQLAGIDYTVSTTNITFTTAPATGSDCIITAMRTAIPTVNATLTSFMNTMVTTANSAAAARTQLELDSMATQAASAVAITGGSVVGITDITVADGGTGASTAANARINLGTRTSAIDSVAASFNDVTTTFPLTVSAAAFTPRDVYGLMCIYNGVAQIPGDAFTVSTTNITFTFTPATGDSCTLWAVNT